MLCYSYVNYTYIIKSGRGWHHIDLELFRYVLACTFNIRFPRRVPYSFCTKISYQCLYSFSFSFASSFIVPFFQWKRVTVNFERQLYKFGDNFNRFSDKYIHKYYINTGMFLGHCTLNLSLRLFCSSSPVLKIIGKEALEGVNPKV